MIFLMSLQSCFLLPTIDKPSRVSRTSATLIDNIFVNIPNQVSISGNIISDISDHFSQFCILKSVAEQTHASIRKVRDYSQFSSDSFTAELGYVDWNEIIHRGGDDINKMFSGFYNKLHNIINKHAPVKSISKRRAKQLTKGIRASIKIKNKLYMSGDDARNKYYRNLIRKLTRISRKQYYHKYFNDNLFTMRKTWEGINSLLNRKKKHTKTIETLKNPGSTYTIDKSKISNILNEHFTSVGANLAKELQKPEKHFSEFLDLNKSPVS